MSFKITTLKQVIPSPLCSIINPFVKHTGILATPNAQVRSQCPLAGALQEKMETQIKLHTINRKALQRGKQGFVEVPELKAKKIEIKHSGWHAFPVNENDRVVANTFPARYIIGGSQIEIKVYSFFNHTYTFHGQSYPRVPSIPTLFKDLLFDNIK